MSDFEIFDGLELVTDLNIIRMFPSADDVTKKQQAFSFMPEKKTVTPFYSKAREQLGILTRLKRKNFAVFDENGNVNPQPRCEWRESDLARFMFHNRKSKRKRIKFQILLVRAYFLRLFPK